MNRHDRRRARKMAPRKTVLEVSIHDPDDVARTFHAALRGDPEAQTRAGIITSWATRMIRTSPGEKPLCVACDRTCIDDLSWSVAIAAPFASAGGKAIVACICPACAARDDINDIVVHDMLDYCGGHVVQAGRA